MSLWSRNFQSLEGKFRGLKNGVELGVSASNLRIAMVQEWQVGGHLGASGASGVSPTPEGADRLQLRVGAGWWGERVVPGPVPVSQEGRMEWQLFLTA